jgi:glycosyltransferase involved in cell wall biosynthesis
MKASIPLVSVLISVHNDEKNIRNAINSILDQTYANIEILIIDDASTDNSFNEIQTTIKGQKKVTCFQNKENVGLTKNLNFLIKNSQGELIARQDSDDISHPDRIEKQVKHLLDNNLDASTTRSTNLQNGKKIPGLSYYLPKKLIMRLKNPFIHGTLLIKKSVLDKVNYYNENYYYSQDYFLFAYLLKNNFNVRTLNESLYSLNTKNNISTNHKNEQMEYSIKVKEYWKSH